MTRAGKILTMLTIEMPIIFKLKIIVNNPPIEIKSKIIVLEINTIKNDLLCNQPQAATSFQEA